MEQENIIEDTGKPVSEELIIHNESTVDTFLEPPILEPPILEPPILEPPILEPPILEPPILESPILEPPILEPPILESPILESPILESPILESPILEPPILESPILESPILESPILESPILESPVHEEYQIVETPAETPVIETPVETPVIETLIETPVVETLVETPVQVTNNSSSWLHRLIFPAAVTTKKEEPVKEEPVKKEPLETIPEEKSNTVETQVEETDLQINKPGWFSWLFFSSKEKSSVVEKKPDKDLQLIEEILTTLLEKPVSTNDIAVQTNAVIDLVIKEETKIIKSAFITAIESVLESTEKQEKYIIKADDEMKTLLQKLIQTKTTVFDSIELTIKNIVSNVSVDSKDIPNLMLLLVEIYEFAFQMKNKNNIIDLCGKTLKFCINVIIEEKIIQNENTTDFIINTHNLIDTGVNLIKLNKNLKKKGKCKGKGKQTLSAVVFELFCNKNTK